MQEPEENVTDSRPDIPEQYLPHVINYLSGIMNQTQDFSKPVLKTHFVEGYYPFVFAYSMLIVSSVLANLAMVGHIFRLGLHLHNPTCAFLVNFAVASIFHMSVAFPITLVVILVQNWIFGQFICLSIAMLQDIPIHISVSTHLLIAYDRYRFLSYPRRPRIPAFVCVLGTWFFAVCIALPHLIYTTFIDLQNFGTKEQREIARGHQLCIANLADDSNEYVIGILFGTFIVPLTLSAHLYIKSSQELESLERGPSSVAVFDARLEDSRSGSRHGSSASNEVTLELRGKRWNESRSTSAVADMSNYSASYSFDWNELDIAKERRTQRHLIAMISSTAVFLFPLQVLRIVRSAVDETYYNTHHIDMIFLIIVWIGFLPALTTPCIYASWQISRPTMDHLHKQLRKFTSHRVMRDRGDSGHQQRPSIEGVLQEHNLRPGDSTPIGGPRSPVATNGCPMISPGFVTDAYLYPSRTTSDQLHQSEALAESANA